MPRSSASSSQAKSPKTKGDRRKFEKMHSEWTTLGNEYDVVAPARSSTGHLTRKVPKTQWKDRTYKRKLLEQADAEAAAMNFQEQPRQRLRGSRAAIEDQLIQESLVFPLPNQSQATQRLEEEEEEDEEEEEEEEEDHVDLGDVDDQDDNAIDDIEDEDEDDDNDHNELGQDFQGVEDEHDDLVGEDEHEDQKADESDVGFEKVETPINQKRQRKSKEMTLSPDNISGRPPKTKKRKMAPKSTSHRRMFRLRNFQSQRLAQRHGEALAAHARGQPTKAIQLLKQVAKGAPSAPQIYSSLGMVYEDMLRQSRERASQTKDDSKLSDPSTEVLHVPASPAEEQVPDNNPDTDESIPDPSLVEQLALAKKAYGSYHIAAILCKKDFTLWLRAADAGSEVAHILTQALLLPNLNPAVIVYHRNEKRRWQSEVLRDLQAADNLHPPGIDVPCKLAAMHIELGNLSEALTILTDLKNYQSTTKPGRSEFQSSYKAWLLYADLMLRVGHECIQWNRGNRTNDNYMFRRWLRKYSEVFDWQERRLQALSLALETAAGTKCTGEFMQWMRDRAYDIHARNSSKQNPEEDSKNVDGNDADAKEQYETEQRMLLAKHQEEMEAFDKTTNDMELVVNSKAAKDRQSNRDDLLKAQENAVATLNKEYDSTPKNALTEKKEDEMMTEFHDFVPMAASCRQVCNIASELMKHLHGLELYSGARLVGEAVSNYLKERAFKYDKRRIASQRVEEWQAKMTQASFLFESYEERSDDEDSTDGASTGFLSDDDDIDKDESSQLIISLRKGILPPELRILYGLALIGEGGRNFLAGKCLEAINDLEQESSSWLTSGTREVEASGDPLWYLFHRAMTEPLGRTAAYAFLADVLRKTRKEQEWSVHFSSWFRNHLKTLTECGLKEQLMGSWGEASPYVSFRKNQLMKILVAACSFDVSAAVNPAQHSPINREKLTVDDSQQVNIAIAAMESLSDLLYLMWKVEPDGSIPPICCEVVTLSSNCLCWLADQASSKKFSYHQLHTILRLAATFLSFLSGETLPDFKSTENVELLTDLQWGKIPIKASWQPREFRQLSLRTYNLTVACNVSLFSGWEPEEFTLQLLRRQHGHKHFGVHLRDHRLAGYLPSSMEEEISRQWDRIREQLPSFPDVNFRERIKNVKEMEWYKAEVEDREKTLQGTSVAKYGEEKAEALFLAFSALCLHLSASEENPKVITRLLQASLSILLPISQFCVDDRLWDSDIGEAATSLSGFDEWKLMSRIGLDAVMDNLTSKSKRKRKRKSDLLIERKVQEWIMGTNKRTIKSFVSLPMKELRNLWFHQAKEVSEKDRKIAVQCMNKVHTLTKKLRACFTEAATEKASLQVSVALLELASSPGCFDPFLCLQHAATFASQACKFGYSDVSYRGKLPEMTECTPLQALVILGRADCLHAVYFPNEAAFLCSYVARVCRLHRENEDMDDAALEWNFQWKIVAIYAFNVSVMIRTTVSTVLDKQQHNTFLSMWERDVVEELERGRSDGRIWKRSLYNSGGGAILSPNEDYNDDFESGEEENSSADEQDNESRNEDEGDHKAKAGANVGDDDDDEGEDEDDVDDDDDDYGDDDSNIGEDEERADSMHIEENTALNGLGYEVDSTCDGFANEAHDFPVPNLDLEGGAIGQDNVDEQNAGVVFDGITMVSV